MIKLEFSEIKNTLMSYNLFNFNFSFNKPKEASNPIIDDVTAVDSCNAIVEAKKYTDYKTILYASDVGVIEKINDDIIAYLFIEKEKDHSNNWNLVTPIIVEVSTSRVIQFGCSGFALQGCGSGLSSTGSLIYKLKNHIEKGYKVSILPKVINNKLLHDYGYYDSNIKLTDLLDNSIDLINYKKGSFKWIYKQYQELLQKYMIDSL